MNDLLLIGQFAALAGISSRMLRHYDKLGLITPVEIDDVNGYRYYADHQLKTLNTLLALQKYGFTLNEIKAINTQPLSLEDFTAKLKDKEILLRQSIDEDTGHLINIQRTITYLSDTATRPGLTTMVEFDQLINKRSQSMKSHSDHTTDALNTLKERAMRLPSSNLFKEQLQSYIESDTQTLKHFITFDLDGFAAVNDLYGYDVGDMVIFTTINLILDTFDNLISSGNGVASRYGGDEIVVFLSNITLDEVKSHVQKAIDQLRQTNWSALGCDKSMTASCGIYSFTQCSEMRAPSHHSAKALMEAKRLGRDQAVFINA